MGGNTANGSQEQVLRNALETARDSEGSVDPAIAAYLEQQLASLWARLSSQPHTYIFTGVEFSLFNYFRQRLERTEIGKAAVERYWAVSRGPPNQSNS